MPGPCRLVFIAAASAGVLAFAAAGACAEGIAPGLWRIASRTVTGGVMGPPHVSSRCFNPAQAKDVVATFVPAAGTDSSSCLPAEHALHGSKLRWRLVCRGETAMEQSGEFIFESAHHYRAKIWTRAVVSGATMVDSQDLIEGQWLSECHQDLGRR
ncbi:MAG: DUF3617 family protein [Hyphomicrobiales bacterium]|nr:DUF3617 family protein [Hyphomicrobiales bacterium]